MKIKNTIIIFFIVLIVQCNSPSDTNSIQIPSYVGIEFSKHGIKPTGPYSEYFFTLPDSLNDANWGLKDMLCTQGGYDLKKHAGKKLRFLKYPSNEHWGNEKLDIWAIIDSQECACVYSAVQSGSTMAPGIFSVNDTSVKK